MMSNVLTVEQRAIPPELTSAQVVHTYANELDMNLETRSQKN